MDFFTLTDSDTIGGCLELAHHPDVFTSCETTVAFPEDDCKIRLLLYGLNDPQLQHILGYRGNIFQVRDYLLAENIVHAVATPLDILNFRLGPDHIEKLLLLFDHFETRSGARQARTNDFITALLEHLTPEFMERLRRKWGIEPASAKPWQKGFIGGSCDYCSQYTGLTWTEVPQADDARRISGGAAAAARPRPAAFTAAPSPPRTPCTAWLSSITSATSGSGTCASPTSSA